jgi:hypothetical protein
VSWCVSDKLRRQIATELDQLSNVIEIYRPLLDRSSSITPTAIELSALGAMLHSFYNGVENILKRIALVLAPSW